MYILVAKLQVQEVVQFAWIDIPGPVQIGDPPVTLVIQNTTE
jgi:hypothetical protein